VGLRLGLRKERREGKLFSRGKGNRLNAQMNLKRRPSMLYIVGITSHITSMHNVALLHSPPPTLAGL